MLQWSAGGLNEMNNMNQYGNNLIAPYGQNGYSHFFNGQNYNYNSQYHLNKIATGYDMVDIIEEQDKKD